MNFALLVLAGIIVFVFGFKILRQLYKAGENDSDLSGTDIKYDIIKLVIALVGWTMLFISIL